MSLLLNPGGRIGDCRKIDDDVGSFDTRLEGDGITASGHANFGGVHRRAAVTANQYGAFLAITYPAADLAGIERGDVVAVGLTHHEKAKSGSLHVHGIEMHGDAAHFG